MVLGRMAGDRRADEVVLSVLLAVSGSKHAVTDGQQRLDRLAGRAVKSFAFRQIVEGTTGRE